MDLVGAMKATRDELWERAGQAAPGGGVVYLSARDWAAFSAACLKAGVPRSLETWWQYLQGTLGEPGSRGESA